ncbi:hypothetical protein A5646_20480 [Mycobacterium sp. 1245499.0]|nr:hypothetical protein A5646_20480 [Mycobacterium sp. 1245499.0]
MTVRRSRGSSGGLSATLPDELRTFESWHYPGGLNDYMRALSELVGYQRLTPVMNAAGLSAADWFREMLLSEA